MDWFLYPGLGCDLLVWRVMIPNYFPPISLGGKKMIKILAEFYNGMKQEICPGSFYTEQVQNHFDK
jgi:hypothetical protein